MIGAFRSVYYSGRSFVSQIVSSIYAIDRQSFVTVGIGSVAFFSKLGS